MINATLIFLAIVISGILSLSFIYRYQLRTEKRAPFDVPEVLHFLFPKPINYENEVSILAEKYQSQFNN